MSFGWPVGAWQHGGLPTGDLMRRRHALSLLAASIASFLLLQRGRGKEGTFEAHLFVLARVLVTTLVNATVFYFIFNIQ
jgi:hypothetical protein